jgi:hypothetical protein
MLYAPDLSMGSGAYSAQAVAILGAKDQPVEPERMDLLKRLARAATDAKMPPERGRAMMRAHYPRVFEGVAVGEEASWMLPTSALTELVQYMEQIAAAYQKKRSKK